jgi:1-phosphofructokinase
MEMIATVTLNPSLDEWVRLDTLRPGELNRAGGFMRYPGGKGINVSRVVKELGGAPWPSAWREGPMAASCAN